MDTCWIAANEPIHKNFADQLKLKKHIFTWLNYILLPNKNYKNITIKAVQLKVLKHLKSLPYESHKSKLLTLEQKFIQNRVFYPVNFKTSKKKTPCIYNNSFLHAIFYPYVHRIVVSACIHMAAEQPYSREGTLNAFVIVGKGTNTWRY